MENQTYDPQYEAEAAQAANQAQHEALFQPPHSRLFIGVPSKSATDNWPMAFSSGSSTIDGEDYSITSNNLKGDEVPEPCEDAKTFALFMAGLLNCYYNEINATDLSPEEIMEMGKKEEDLNIPHPDNTPLPF